MMAPDLELLLRDRDKFLTCLLGMRGSPSPVAIILYCVSETDVVFEVVCLLQQQMNCRNEFLTGFVRNTNRIALTNPCPESPTPCITQHSITQHHTHKEPMNVMG